MRKLRKWGGTRWALPLAGMLILLIAGAALAFSYSQLIVSSSFKVGTRPQSYSQFTVAASSGDTVVKGTFQAYKDLVRSSDATTTISASDYGKTLIIGGTHTSTLTLPANGASAGSWIRVMLTSDTAAVTVAAATADTLITVNDAQADSVTYASGQRIGACLKVISNGTYWIVVNEGSTTMTVTT